MIQSGVYKKALKSYYASQKEDDANTIADSGSADSKVTLSNMKSAASKLSSTMADLKTMDFDSAEDEDLVSKVKEYVTNYNSTINSAKNLNSYGMLQTSVWMKEQTDTAEGLLNNVGITIGDNNTLSLNEETLKSASKADLKTLFNGSSSYGARVASQASALVNQATSQIALNSGTTTYTSSGLYNT